MAHLMIEISAAVARSIDTDALCQALHHSMVETGIFPLAGIRVRLFEADACAIADKHPLTCLQPRRAARARATHSLAAAAERLAGSKARQNCSACSSPSSRRS